MSTPNRAYCCTVIDQEGLGKSVVFAKSSGKARYATALAAADAGFLPRPNPAAIRCIRAPEHDSSQLLAAKPNLPFNPRYLDTMTTPTRFRMATKDVVKELGRSSQTLLRFRRSNVLRPGVHFIAQGCSTVRPWLLWDPDATRIALEQYSRRNLK